jgi:hypothetical protein
MAGIVLRADAALWVSLESHLLAGGVEQVAFLLADGWPGESPGLRLRAVSPVSKGEFSYQGAFHVSLKDEVRPRMIKWAWDEGRCLVEAHSHRQGPAAFSPTDLAGLEEFVPHMWWRLQRPYAALVLAPGSFDGLVWWESPDTSIGVDGVEVDGSTRLRTATGLSHRRILREGRRRG